jgi:hypothetical protein
MRMRGRLRLRTRHALPALLVLLAPPAPWEPTFTKSGGTTPRDLGLDPTGTFLYAAEQDTGNVVAFRFDVTQGTLAATGSTVIAHGGGVRGGPGAVVGLRDEGEATERVVSPVRPIDVGSVDGDTDWRRLTRCERRQRSATDGSLHDGAIR